MPERSVDEAIERGCRVTLLQLVSELQLACRDVSPDLTSLHLRPENASRVHAIARTGADPLQC